MKKTTLFILGLTALSFSFKSYASSSVDAEPIILRDSRLAKPMVSSTVPSLTISSPGVNQKETLDKIYKLNKVDYMILDGCDLRDVEDSDAKQIGLLEDSEQNHLSFIVKAQTGDQVWFLLKGDELMVSPLNRKKLVSQPFIKWWKPLADSDDNVIIKSLRNHLKDCRFFYNGKILSAEPAQTSKSPQDVRILTTDSVSNS